MRAARGMSWVVDTRAATTARPGTIGPGRIILVVGPSGVGKDTLIDGARAACQNDQRIVFPRRVVTRPPSQSEQNDPMSESEFRQAVSNGAFALWWEAHGNQYGIPSSIDDHVRRGHTVICNVSRTIVRSARLRYSQAIVVLVTAPAKILQARLAARGRLDDGSLDERFQRSAEVQDCSDADFVIHNARRREVGVRRLVNVIRDSGFYIIT
jgi:ribose 1,5-bisphosphokinase